MIAFLGRFFVVFILTTIVCTVLWELFVNGRIYNCTDPIGLDYLHPGDWVHEFNGQKVAVVPHVFADSDMSHPDTIEQGWTVAGIWRLWFCFFGGSLICSGWFARRPWGLRLRPGPRAG